MINVVLRVIPELGFINLDGGHFMADLLVTSLMADGGLEAALEASLLGKCSTLN